MPGTQAAGAAAAGKTDDADVIVVGAGHNGLICAAYLARAGLRTTLVEARSTVGGCASTVEALGARVNICNCDHIAIRGMPIADELELASYGLDYIDLEPSQVSISWDGGHPMVTFYDVERTLDALGQTHPDQVDGYRRYLRAALPIAKLIAEVAQQPPSARSILGTALRQGGRPAARLLSWSRRSVADVLRRYLSDPCLIGAAISTGPAVWGVPPNLPGTGAGAVATVMKHVVNAGRPIGGSGALTDAIAACFAAAGGELKCDALVSAIHVDGDRVNGVAIDGDVLTARNVVVACDPHRAIVHWLRDAPAGANAFVERWRRRKVLHGFESKLDAVVEVLPSFKAHRHPVFESQDITPLVATNVIVPSADGVATAHRAMEAGLVAERPIMFANVPSVADPTMSAGDAHVLSLEVLFTPYDIRGGWDASSEPERWLDLLTGLVEPGFRGSVREWRAMTPDRYEQEFHLPRGHASSFVGGPLAALHGRRDRELSRYQTPVGGLFLTGAATFPGAGIWGASGRNAAHVVLKTF